MSESKEVATWTRWVIGLGIAGFVTIQTAVSGFMIKTMMEQNSLSIATASLARDNRERISNVETHLADLRDAFAKLTTETALLRQQIELDRISRERKTR